MFLATEEQDSTYSLKSAITFYLWNTWHAMLPHKKFQNVEIAIYYAYSGFKLWENGLENLNLKLNKNPAYKQNSCWFR